jgi:hypothetical protein
VLESDPRSAFSLERFRDAVNELLTAQSPSGAS